MAYSLRLKASFFRLWLTAYGLRLLGFAYGSQLMAYSFFVWLIAYSLKLRASHGFFRPPGGATIGLLTGTSAPRPASPGCARASTSPWMKLTNSCIWCCRSL